MRLLKSAIVVFLYLAATLTLRAEKVFVSSLEWLADTSARIGIYTVTKIERNSYTSFVLVEPVKAKPEQAIRSSFEVASQPGSRLPAVAVGDRFLIFTRDNVFSTIGGISSYRFINLSRPQSGDLPSYAFNCIFKVLKQETAIMATVRERIMSSHPTTTAHVWLGPKTFDVVVPTASPVWEELFYGNPFYLLVPEDLRPANPKE